MDGDKNKFPKHFFNVSERSFEWVYENKPDYVDFTINEMKNCSGFFKKWQSYCNRKFKAN